MYERLASTKLSWDAFANEDDVVRGSARAGSGRCADHLEERVGVGQFGDAADPQRLPRAEYGYGVARRGTEVGRRLLLQHRAGRLPIAEDRP